MLKIIIKNLIKNTVEQLAEIAVHKAEQAIGLGKGHEKKVMAVNYIMSKLKLPKFLEFLRPCIENTLLTIIDEFVEVAVDKLNNIQNNLMAGQ